MHLSNHRRSPFDFRAWLVDLDGTLYCSFPVRVLMTVQLLIRGWPAIPIIKRFRHEQELLRRESTTLVNEDPFEAQLRRTAESLGVEMGLVRTVVQRWMFDIPAPWLRAFRRNSLVAQIRRFREHGGRAAVVSDYPADQKLVHMGVDPLFDAVVASGESSGLTRLKPHPEAMLLAAEQLGVAPRDCLVIGDRPDADLQAARRAAMAFATPNLRHVTLSPQ